MKIALTERFQHDIRALDDSQRHFVFDVLLSLVPALGQPHRHAGLGLRKLHRSGIWEARVGRALRLVFTLRDDCLTLDRVGSHEEVRRYLKGL